MKSLNREKIKKMLGQAKEKLIKGLNATKRLFRAGYDLSLCLTTSYKITAADTEAFSESVLPNMGMETI